MVYHFFVNLTNFCGLKSKLLIIAIEIRAIIVERSMSHKATEKSLDWWKGGNPSKHCVNTDYNTLHWSEVCQRTLGVHSYFRENQLKVEKMVSLLYNSVSPVACIVFRRRAIINAFLTSHALTSNHHLFSVPCQTIIRHFFGFNGRITL